MIKVMGYERKSGDFTPSGATAPISYDNVILHITNDDCGVDGFVGTSCEQLKIKSKDIPKIFGCTYDELILFKDCPVELKYSLVGGKPVLSKIVRLDTPTDDFTFDEKEKGKK